MSFDYDLDFEHLNFRQQPNLYQIGRGVQGVFVVQPYKRELLPLWRTGHPLWACDSASGLFEKYLEYKADGDFVGMDMARKFIQVGYLCSRRLAHRLPWHNHRMTLCARIFLRVLMWVVKDNDYRRMRARHGSVPVGETLVAQFIGLAEVAVS